MEKGKKQSEHLDCRTLYKITSPLCLKSQCQVYMLRHTHRHTDTHPRRYYYSRLRLSRLNCLIPDYILLLKKNCFGDNWEILKKAGDWMSSENDC